jgi:hypothetical protein
MVSDIGSVSRLTKVSSDQFQFVLALYVALPPFSRSLPPERSRNHGQRRQRGNDRDRLERPSLCSLPGAGLCAGHAESSWPGQIWGCWIADLTMRRAARRSGHRGCTRTKGAAEDQRTDSLSGHNDKPEEYDRDGDKRRRYHPNNFELQYEQFRHRKIGAKSLRLLHNIDAASPTPRTSMGRTSATLWNLSPVIGLWSRQRRRQGCHAATNRNLRIIRSDAGALFHLARIVDESATPMPTR